MIKKIENILTSVPEVKLAYLIGSRSKGNALENSDVDIVLVTSRDEVKSIDYSHLYGQIQSVLSDELDLRIVSLDSSPLFLSEVIDGELLYVKSEEDRVEFVRESLLVYYRTQYLRDIFNQYLDQRIEQETYGQ
ncbi:MAG: nucleotidyltransferase domain-containing protein [Nanoarchaeota archaeon]|nr:nucleotidyltransferase domain-containing protein [Nanoarchaeota archaeon]